MRRCRRRRGRDVGRPALHSNELGPNDFVSRAQPHLRPLRRRLRPWGGRCVCVPGGRAAEGRPVAPAAEGADEGAVRALPLRLERHEPGRPKCQYHGAKRSCPDSLHQGLAEGVRPHARQHHLRRVPRHRDRAGGPHRGGILADGQRPLHQGKPADAGGSQDAGRPSGTGGRSRRSHEDHPHVGVQHHPAELPLRPAERALQSGWFPSEHADRGLPEPLDRHLRGRQLLWLRRHQLAGGALGQEA
mmetsp:Transcript_74351/g.234842  ORF Transcript_74351/g.234842 Transcript_74351/m.234842 type:complete len:245 (+) Transcript_74351:1171-1905(+)